MCSLIHADDAEERRRKRRARAIALGLLLFSPWKKLRPQIAMASHDFEDYFDSVDAALSVGTLSEALRSGRSTVSALTKLIRAARIGGFTDGGELVGVKPGSRYTARAEREAASRAEEVSGMMLRTSKKWLKADPSNEFALSSARGERAAKFEAAKGYYDGLHQALWNGGFSKSWLTTSDDPCDECIANEDEGVIPMEEQFQSGDYAPLLHPSCQCILEVHPPGSI